MSTAEEKYCPHCDRFGFNVSIEYQNGARAAMRVLAKIGNDEARRANWEKFLIAFSEESKMVTNEIAEYLKGALETIQKAAPKK